MQKTMGRRNLLRYLVPGFIFQSLVIGGGYGTGAEITQYFGVHGLVGGLAGMAVSLAVWSLLCAVTFEFVRLHRAFDYNAMMGMLLGRGRVLYELCYLAATLLVLGVINATAGSMFASLLGKPWLGVALLSAGVVVLVAWGTEAVETALSVWSYVLYAVYFLFMLSAFTRFGGQITAELAAGEITGPWFTDGLRYAFYNLGIVPALLYTVRDVKSRGEAVACGLIAGLIGIIPAALLLLAMAGDLSAACAAKVPVTVIFQQLDSKWLYLAFEIVLFGALIETGTGFIKALSDRMERVCARGRRSAPLWVRPLVAGGAVVIGISISSLGLTELISKGYGTICWGFLLVYVLPMLTVGMRKIICFPHLKKQPDR